LLRLYGTSTIADTGPVQRVEICGKKQFNSYCTLLPAQQKSSRFVCDKKQLKQLSSIIANFSRFGNTFYCVSPSGGRGIRPPRPVSMRRGQKNTKFASLEVFRRKQNDKAIQTRCVV
jgi:hypothetical protein